MNWTNWYAETKKHPIYSQQELAISAILRDYEFNSVLDVGCGNKRFNTIFYNKQYSGIDLITGWNANSEWNFGNYDLVFSSLFLMGFDYETAKSYLQKMFEHADKYVFICEETGTNNADKYNHNYVGMAGKKPIAYGRLDVNFNWEWYLWKK